MMRENENHLFKWVDEALLEEIRMVEEKCKLVAEDVNALRMEVMGTMKLQNENFKKMEEKMEDVMSKKIEGEVKIMKENVEELGHVMAKSALKTVGVASVILCSIVWLWGRV
ncbi:uncharacterized protein At4g04775-like [Arabidopsis lyrata subsp. lyrata]|uniref:uncharacterized protein At4g04775-like n=2 Tax=Arabidopsis lyrata subsp. lyrata TaxID=81972 RepID=UPI000A29C04D|nr:uncharacterized protein At4g04775-like [Arabidopsis lyrata subsp. lyrata]|eukprot:XP_020876112.1 uncharacterized protein At4g04775-like [Arabidopsis lyrata subsp. lyrata]